MERAREDQEQFECQELTECEMQLGVPEEEDGEGEEEERQDAGLVAEAEAVAAGWMLDFLCLSLCRAFRDGRSEDFHRTRDSAEGEGRVAARGRWRPGFQPGRERGSGGGSAEARLNEPLFESRFRLLSSRFCFALRKNERETRG